MRVYISPLPNQKDKDKTTDEIDMCMNEMALLPIMVWNLVLANISNVSLIKYVKAQALQHQIMPDDTLIDAERNSFVYFFMFLTLKPANL